MGKPAEVASSLHHSLTHLLWERNPFPTKPLFPVWTACPAFRVDCVALKQTAYVVSRLTAQAFQSFCLSWTNEPSILIEVVQSRVHSTQPFLTTSGPQFATCGRRQSPFVAPLTSPLFLVPGNPAGTQSSFLFFILYDGGRAARQSVSLSPHSASGHRQTHSYCHIAVSSSSRRWIFSLFHSHRCRIRYRRPARAAPTNQIFHLG